MVSVYHPTDKISLVRGQLQLRDKSFLRTTPFYAKKTDIEQGLTVSYAGERKFQKLTKKKTTLLDDGSAIRYWVIEDSDSSWSR